MTNVVNFVWGSGSPGAGVGADNFSVRWRGIHTFLAGDYTFTARADDGIRLKVDGVTIIDAWLNQSTTGYMVTKRMTAGDHLIMVEYYERGGSATAQVLWTPGNLLKNLAKGKRTSASSSETSKANAKSKASVNR